MWYSAHNHYASETDVGFANTWFVYAWETKKARDKHVEKCRDMASRAIRKKEIGHYLGAVQPFSGEGYRLQPEQDREQRQKGLLGTITITNSEYDLVF
jgi:hypothetical protein